MALAKLVSNKSIKLVKPKKCDHATLKIEICFFLFRRNGVEWNGMEWVWSPVDKKEYLHSFGFAENDSSGRENFVNCTSLFSNLHFLSFNIALHSC